MESVKMKKATKTVAFRQLAIYCNIVDNQLLTMQIITNTVYQMFIKTWYKYGLSVSFLTIENHKKIGNKYKYRPFL